MMVLLRAAMASARLSVRPPLPPGRRPLRAPNRSAGGGLAAAAAGVGRFGVAAGIGAAPATAGLGWAAGVSPELSTAPAGPLHGLSAAGGAGACVAFTAGGVATRRAISGA